MGRKAKGYRAGTRTLFRRHPRERGKTSLTKILQSYAVGEKVVLKIDPSVHKGMPHRRYQGKVGAIAAKRGRSYVIHVPVKNATKEIIARPEHLEPFSSGRGD